MNRKQAIVMWVGITAVVAMGVYLPWVFTDQDHGLRLDGGYTLISEPPPPHNKLAVSATIDFWRLGVQWLVVAVIAVGLMATLRTKRTPPTTD